ncbi:Holliday junction DNA helicase RuvA [Candidatus Giovannonibacteria bacterium RIFCSPLOWO2_02_FULL_43_11b]|uniref:Holliday junction branch migration complex subunit RuvA n=1 Tax=Candidatus Giovannonibacteria bacterium RIFCSPHIGHO2_12_FULL_43_15 TaxID=1798341 RepID=A0A1F5WPL5_9BACT|nr:MAG: Holliday junction DNA helicase RuvA [Candidatus Giovannonibacteria bacterium RIFCSPHIGHO2_01_FULL_43_100]OGF66768.1 MAG: Holliday junction DNA helicase RuvA [Candidatus Giovannonibacteria bacterium RIFCSPHIGHO2_02_FULL_43_32]OGF77544.1 MAG: Holliday junction DNA helicase RuvA [Candidatus Giovannonibacteria bacterium RIFCSPHIGHO2_12_FULL_43_15]OGF79005.1 MAG: Holliday junction DNA helicase RuvA [Candidatus Giovannonibacteria bacterium RIFCSPLOWO2_01_FULL_43_60]OGF90381.1 MAG: Holliday ju
MIGYLEGKVISRREKHIILNVGGVGYKVMLNTETLHKFSEGSDAKIWTHLQQREDTIELYGFITPDELELFETLISVSGVGPKTALSVLGVAPADTLKRAISSGEIGYLTKVSGIGRKTAEKIMLELREKFGKATVEGVELKEEQDVIEALESLGYSARDVREALRKIPDEIKGTSKRVKEALKILGGNG